MFQMHINVLEMRPAAEFGTYKPPAIAGDDSLQGRMLIRVSSAGRLEDHFRLAVKAPIRLQQISTTQTFQTIQRWPPSSSDLK